MSPSKLTKYCACHAKWPPNISQKFAENSWNVISNARPIRDRSETVPRPFLSVRNPPRNRGYFSRSGRAFCIEKYNISRSGYLSKFHQVLRLPRKVTLDLHQVLRLPRKVTLDLHQVLRLPRKVTLDLHQVLRLPREAWSSSHMKRHLQCAEQQMSPSKLTKYCACHAKWPPNISQKFAENSWNVISNARPIRDRSETVPRPFPSVRNPPRNRGYFSRSGRAFCIEKYNISRSGYLSKFHQVLRLPRKVTLDLHQVLRLPRKVTLDLHQVLRLPRKVTLDLHQVLRLPRKAWSSSHMKRHLQCAEQQMSPSKLTKYCACHAKWPPNIWQKFAENSWNVISNARPIRDRSDHDPRMNPSVRNPPRNRGYLSRSGRAFCIEKYNISRSGYLSKFHQILRLSRKVTLDLHQVLRQSRKVTFDLHQVLCLPRKVTLDLHQVLPLSRKVTLDLHQVLHLPRKVTLDLHQVLRLPRKAWSSSHMKRHLQCAEQQMSPSKLTKYCACHAKWPPNIWQKFAENSWNVISNARPIRDRSDHDPRMNPSVRNPPRNRGYLSRSGRAFCIEKCNISSSSYLSKFHQVLRLPRKVTLELHQVLRLPRKVTLELHQVLRLPPKVTLELHQVLRLPRKVTLELHQVLRLPRKVTLELHQCQVLRLPRKVTLPSTAPTTKSDTWTSPSTAPATKSDTWTSPSSAPSINWLYYYSAILLIDSTITQRF